MMTSFQMPVKPTAAGRYKDRKINQTIGKQLSQCVRNPRVTKNTKTKNKPVGDLFRS